MNYHEFKRQAELLTGTEVKGEDQIDRGNLERILAHDDRRMDRSQLNELLLMVHKDRVERPFFDLFFGANSTIGSIPQAVQAFQKAAMRRYGNFVFAYRTLSRIQSDHGFRSELDDVGRTSDERTAYYADRQPKLLDIDLIARDRTPFVGYLSDYEVESDYIRCDLLRKASELAGPGASWEQIDAQAARLPKPSEVANFQSKIHGYRARFPDAGPGEFGEFIRGSLDRLRSLREDVRRVRQTASRNQSTYLTWDHMDVYFATSMRKAWEYKDLFSFIESLMQNARLQLLDIRYFDPTQSYTDNRVDKGLVEALMLKRAWCTVYSVQDTDTLGKDSELASTLAQGKPVIAYVPQIEIGPRAQELISEDLDTVYDRYRFVAYEQEGFQAGIDSELRVTAERLRAFVEQEPLRSIPDIDAAARLKDELDPRLHRLCEAIAQAESGIYDRRARTLKRAASPSNPSQPRHWCGKWSAGCSQHSSLRCPAREHSPKQPGVYSARRARDVVSPGGYQ